MLLLSVTAALLAATPPVKLAAPGLTVQGLEATSSAVYLNFLAEQLGKDGDIELATAEQLTAILSVERQKELLGCSEQSSQCLAELAGGLGVDGVVTGSLARAGTELLLTLRAASSTNRQLGGMSVRASSESQLLDAIELQAPRFGNDIRRALGRPIKQQTGSSPRYGAWAATGVGGVAAATGAVFMVMANGTATNIRQGSATLQSRSDLSAALARGRGQQTLGMAGLGIGAAGLALGTVLFLLPASSDTATVSVGVHGDGAGIAAGGTF